MRGLKLWISRFSGQKTQSHLLQMRGLKLRWLLTDSRCWCRIFYRCVDWNWILQWELRGISSRIFYRCVDWNNRHLRIVISLLQSHLLQMRGLKLSDPDNVGEVIRSHLLQMRGLKQKSAYFSDLQYSRIFYRCVDWNPILTKEKGYTVVASFTDAWIETRMARSTAIMYWVASFTDAWIETEINDINEHVNLVASFTDAWIETGNMILYRIPLRSHLLQMRGLKLFKYLNTGFQILSHLLQMRGLKRQRECDGGACHCRIFYRCVDWNQEGLEGMQKKISRIFYRCVDWNFSFTTDPLLPEVASFTDAWIETTKGTASTIPQIVASFTDAWIETSMKRFADCDTASRIFYRCVDWNIREPTGQRVDWRRIFYRCVDWNLTHCPR